MSGRPSGAPPVVLPKSAEMQPCRSVADQRAREDLGEGAVAVVAHDRPRGAAVPRRDQVEVAVPVEIEHSESPWVGPAQLSPAGATKSRATGSAAQLSGTAPHRPPATPSSATIGDSQFLWMLNEVSQLRGRDNHRRNSSKGLCAERDRGIRRSARLNSDSLCLWGLASAGPLRRKMSLRHKCRLPWLYREVCPLLPVHSKGAHDIRREQVISV